MARHRFRADPLAPAAGEINLIPYLDVMVNLTMFLLLTLHVLPELHHIPFDAPGGGSGDARPQLTVRITAAGHEIVSGTSGARARVPLVAGDYDYAGLTARLDRIQRAVPVADGLIVVAEPHIRYAAVVATLDAARTAPDARDLFPDVTLAMPLEAR